MASLLYILLVIGGAVAVEGSTMYPYGPAVNDIAAAPLDDESVTLTLSRGGANFYGHQSTHASISANGLVAFDGSNWSFFPIIPFDSDRYPDYYYLSEQLLAVFHEDSIVYPIPPDYASALYYRQEQGGDSGLVDQMTADVAAAFPCEADFVGDWAMVATWHEVYEFALFALYGDRINNTFQLGIVANDHKTFAFLNYDHLDWTGGWNWAEAGFNHGDGYRYHFLPNSTTPYVSDLQSTSNIDVPGRYAYRVDRPFIKEGACPPEVCICQVGDNGYELPSEAHDLASIINFQGEVSGLDDLTEKGVDLAVVGDGTSACDFRLVGNMGMERGQVVLANAVFYFGIGRNGKFHRNLKIQGPGVALRGQGIGSPQDLDLSSPYTYDDGVTQLRLIADEDLFLIQSETCSWELEYQRKPFRTDVVTLSAGPNAGPFSAGLCGQCSPGVP